MTYAACIANTGTVAGCTNATADSLFGSFGAAASPDGKNLYSVNGTGITTFNRDPVAGGLTYGSCITVTGGPVGCTGPVRDALGNSYGVAVSPDGKNVYVVGGSNAVTTFTRDPNTGALTYLNCIGNFATVATYGCIAGTNDSFGAAWGVVVSPDSKSVYVAAQAGAVTTLTRNLGTGALTYLDCITSTGGLAGCATTAQTNTMAGMTGVLVSPDGQNVYTVNPNATDTFSRNPATGALTYSDCIAFHTGVGCPHPAQPSLGGSWKAVASPDGKNVYVTAASGPVTTLTRDQTTGTLTYAACLANSVGPAGCTTATHDSLGGGYFIALDPAGKNVYVPNTSASGLTTLTRDTATGALTYGDCIANSGNTFGCPAATNNSLANASGVVVSPDGMNVYTAAVGNPAVTTFNRAQTAQTITFTPPAATSLSAGTVAVSATATSGLPVVFTSATPAVCTVAGTTVSLVTTGTCTINADQAGDATYAAAAQVQGSFTVAPADTPTDTSAATPGTTPGTTGQAQVPVGGCVTPPRSIPRTGLRRLLKARCLTNAGQKVRVSVSGGVPVARWDVTYLRAVTKKHGRVLLRTYGYPRLKVSIVWSASATGSYAAYTMTRTYRT